jgi:hypothetical protein
MLLWLCPHEGEEALLSQPMMGLGLQVYALVGSRMGPIECGPGFGWTSFFHLVWPPVEACCFAEGKSLAFV